MGPDAEVALEAEGVIGGELSDVIDEVVLALEGDATDGGQKPAGVGSFGPGRGDFFWA